MAAEKPLQQWLTERQITFDQLVERSMLDKRVIEAIVAARYTPSPQQRTRVAQAVGVAADEIAWGNRIEVDHMYGHGPQFGRSP